MKLTTLKALLTATLLLAGLRQVGVAGIFFDRPDAFPNQPDIAPVNAELQRLGQIAVAVFGKPVAIAIASSPNPMPSVTMDSMGRSLDNRAVDPTVMIRLALDAAKPYFQVRNPENASFTLEAHKLAYEPGQFERRGTVAAKFGRLFGTDAINRADFSYERARATAFSDFAVTVVTSFGDVQTATATRRAKLESSTYNESFGLNLVYRLTDGALGVGMVQTQTEGVSLIAPAMVSQAVFAGLGHGLCLPYWWAKDNNYVSDETKAEMVATFTSLPNEMQREWDHLLWNFVQREKIENRLVCAAKNRAGVAKAATDIAHARKLLTACLLACPFGFFTDGTAGVRRKELPTFDGGNEAYKASAGKQLLNMLHAHFDGSVAGLRDAYDRGLITVEEFGELRRLTEAFPAVATAAAAQSSNYLQFLRSVKSCVAQCQSTMVKSRVGGDHWPTKIVKSTEGWHVEFTAASPPHIFNVKVEFVVVEAPGN